MSLTTSWSPGCSHCGSSATLRSRSTPSALHDQHPRGIARARGPQRDAGGGEFEVEEIGAHRSSCRRARSSS